MRFCFCSGINITPMNGATSAFYLYETNNKDLDPFILYHSEITPLGHRWVRKLKVQVDDVEHVVTKLDKLVEKFKMIYYQNKKSSQ